MKPLGTRTVALEAARLDDICARACRRGLARAGDRENMAEGGGGGRRGGLPGPTAGRGPAAAAGAAASRGGGLGTPRGLQQRAEPWRRARPKTRRPAWEARALAPRRPPALASSPSTGAGVHPGSSIYGARYTLRLAAPGPAPWAPLRAALRPAPGAPGATPRCPRSGRPWPPPSPPHPAPRPACRRPRPRRRPTTLSWSWPGPRPSAQARAVAPRAPLPPQMPSSPGL